MVLTQLFLFQRFSALALLFPYHYGSHATSKEDIKETKVGKEGFHTTMVLTQQSEATSWLIRSFFRFHTTMVLTQHSEGSGRDLRKYYVSIPLWFSRNLAFQTACAMVHMFPYHYGSHATREPEPLRTHTERVSIPLWFSRNFLAIDILNRDIQFPYHYGSHATYYTNITAYNYQFCFHTTMVLTQRKKTGYKLQPAFVFPYHYGSHATGPAGQNKRFCYLFPYHYGSHATLVLGEIQIDVSMFPYHYGSHATQNESED